MADAGFPSDGSGIPIANSALILVGTRLISAATDSSKECKLVSTNWDTYRRAALREGLWKFAKEQVQLVADPDYAPITGFSIRYPLPADYLRLVSFNDVKGDADGSGAPYRVMGDFIYSNMSYANIIYISDVTDVSMFDPLFCEYLSAYIYDKLCKTLTGAAPDPKILMKAKRIAAYVDSVEDPSMQLDIDVWLQSRVGGPMLHRDPPFPPWNGGATPGT